MSWPVALLTVFLLIAFVPKAHSFCIRIVSSMVVFLYRVSVSVVQYPIHFYKVLSKKTLIMICIGMGILFFLIYGKPEVLLIFGVGGIALKLGYHIVQSTTKWFRRTYGPTVMPMYSLPKEWSAAQIYFIMNDRWIKKAVFISLIQMVCNGFLELKTRTTNTKEGVQITACVFNRTGRVAKTEDEFLYDSVVGSDGSITLDNGMNPLLNQFNKELAALTKDKTKNVIYYKYPFQRYFLIAALCCFPLIYILEPLGQALHTDWPQVFFLIVVVMYGIGTFVSKNKKHSVFKQIAGLRMFLRAVCKNDDISIKSSDLKEMLPYALALDIDGVWDQILPDAKDNMLQRLFQPDCKQLVMNAVEEIKS